eukprot:5835461-Karenia_brevis.AAC.1
MIGASNAAMGPMIRSISHVANNIRINLGKRINDSGASIPVMKMIIRCLVMYALVMAPARGAVNNVSSMQADI